MVLFVYLFGLSVSKTTLRSLRGEPISQNTLGPLDVNISPVGFLSQIFWGLISPVELLGFGVPDRGTNLLLLSKYLSVEIVPYCVPSHQGWDFCENMYLPLLLSRCGPFIFSVESSSSSNFHIIFQGK